MRWPFTFSLLCCFTGIYAQSQSGLRMENYAGVTALRIQPTAQFFHPNAWDIQIGGGGFSITNNYAFIAETNSTHLWRNRKTAEFVIAKELDGATGDQRFVVDFPVPARRYFAYAMAYMEGPSFAFRIGENHAAGFTTGTTALLTSMDIPAVYGIRFYDDQNHFESFRVSPFHIGGIFWSEAGVSYAYRQSFGDYYMALGIHLRHLQGYEAVYVRNNTTFLHTKLPDYAIAIQSPNGRFGYASSNLEGAAFRPQRNGNGWAADAGMAMVFGEREDGYEMRMGFSVFNLGAITFRQNAHVHRLATNQVHYLSWEDYRFFNNLPELDEIISLFSFQTIGDSAALLEGNRFRIGLPASLSLQADWMFAGRCFLNLHVLQRLPSRDALLRNPNQIVFTPRFEHRWFMAALPVSLVEWQKLRTGLALRLGFVVIGTDDLASWMGRRKWYGTDLYFAVRIPPVDFLFSGKNQHRNASGKKSRKVRCYQF